DGEVVERCRVDNPLTFIEKFQQRYKVPDVAGLPRFHGGLVGYFGYDTVRYIEPRLAKSAPADPIGTPDILLMVSEQLVVFDNLSGKLHLIELVDPSQPNAYEQAQQRVSNGVRKLRQAGSVEQLLPRHESKGATVSEQDFVSGRSEERRVGKEKRSACAGFSWVQKSRR